MKKDLKKEYGPGRRLTLHDEIKKSPYNLVKRTLYRL
jgi:hypothetical protein